MTRTTEDEARRYLLGRLSDDEGTAIERAYFADPERADAIAAAESDLVDAYVAGVLPPADRAAFEAHYLASPLHRDRVETARLLRREGVERRPAPRRAAAAVWIGLLTAAGLAAVALWWTRAPIRPEATIAQAPPSTRAAETAAAKAPAEAPVPPKRIVTLRLALAAIRVRGAEATPELRVPPHTDEVALELAAFGEVPAGALSFTVRTVEGTPVASGRMERSGRTLGTARLPAGRLAPDDYIVAVSSADETAIAQYFFRVVPAR